MGQATVLHTIALLRPMLATSITAKDEVNATLKALLVLVTPTAPNNASAFVPNVPMPTSRSPVATSKTATPVSSAPITITEANVLTLTDAAVRSR